MIALLMVISPLMRNPISTKQEYNIPASVFVCPMERLRVPVAWPRRNGFLLIPMRLKRNVDVCLFVYVIQWSIDKSSDTMECSSWFFSALVSRRNVTKENVATENIVATERKADKKRAPRKARLFIIHDELI